jgi:hypothetical protein
MVPYIHLPLACEHVTSPISASEPGELWWRPESEIGQEILRRLRPKSAGIVYTYSALIGYVRSRPCN